MGQLLMEGASPLRQQSSAGTPATIGGMSYGGNLLAGSSIEWYTPPEIFTALDLRFDLDPCAPKGGVPWVPADRHFSIEDDGLTQPWTGRVWLNPPYGKETRQWVERLARHGNGVSLVFARTDTAWGQQAIASADAVCLIAGRLSFVAGHEPDGLGHNAAAPSMLLAYGHECAEAVRNCGLGLVFTAEHLIAQPSAATLWEAA